MRDKCVEMSENANKMRDRLVELIKAFYMVGQPLYIITEERKLVERIVRTFKYLDDLGIEFECTLWK